MSDSTRQLKQLQDIDMSQNKIKNVRVIKNDYDDISHSISEHELDIEANNNINIKTNDFNIKNTSNEVLVNVNTFNNQKKVILQNFNEFNVNTGDVKINSNDDIQITGQTLEVSVNDLNIKSSNETEVSEIQVTKIKTTNIESNNINVGNLNVTDTLKFEHFEFVWDESSSSLIIRKKVE